MSKVELTDNLYKMFENCNSTKIPCFLCGHIFKSDEESWMIFDGSLQKSLSSILSLALKLEINEKTAHSIFLCNDCRTQILQYGSLKQRFNDLRKAVLNVYKRTAKPNNLERISFDGNLAKDATENDSCQVDSKIGIIFENTLNTANDDEILIKNEKLIIEDINNSIDEETYERNDDSERALPSCNFNSFSRETILYKETKNIDNDMELYIKEHVDETTDNLDETMTPIKNEYLYGESNTNTEIVNQNDEISIEKSITPTLCRYGCHICFQIFETADTLKVHKETHKRDSKPHGEKIEKYKRFECDICNKKFSKNYNLSQHKKRHIDNSKNFECEICNKKYTTKGILTQHKKIHIDNSKNFECEICKKKFYQKDTLLQHEKIHTQSKNFECEICNKMFTTKGTLREHKKRHLDNSKIFECDICNKKFSIKGNFTQHKKIHFDKIRDYECEICKKKFYKKDHLSQHKKRHIENSKN